MCIRDRTLTDPTLHLAVHLSMILSLRVGEILGLQPGDIDFEMCIRDSCGRAGQRRCKTGVGTAFGVNGDHEQGFCLFTRFALQNFQRALRFEF